MSITSIAEAVQAIKNMGTTASDAGIALQSFTDYLHEAQSGPQEHEIRIMMAQVPTRIAIDIPRRRLFVDCPHQQAYDWIVERWDNWDIIAIPYPIVLGRQPLTAADGWSLSFGDRAHPLMWPAPSN